MSTDAGVSCVVAVPGLPWWRGGRLPWFCFCIDLHWTLPKWCYDVLVLELLSGDYGRLDVRHRAGPNGSRATAPPLLSSVRLDPLLLAPSGASPVARLQAGVGGGRRSGR